MRQLLIVATIASVALTACRKRQPKTEPSPAPGTEQPVVLPTTPSAVTTPAGTPAQGAGTSGVYATAADIAVYNKALYEYCYRVSDIPTDLNDLKGRRGLPPLPVPPPGRRLVYQPDLKLMELKTAFIRLE